MKKSVIAILVTAILFSAMSVFTVNAATYSGTCGDNVKWTFKTDTGVLTISGTGPMDDYSESDYNYPTYFDYVDKVKKIVVSSGVTTIGCQAFSYCSNATSVTIPSSVTKIIESAFYKCSSLESISIGKNVEYIGTGTFMYCDKLKTISVDSKNEYYYVKNNCLISSDGTLIRAINAKSTTIPDEVYEIGWGAFAGNDITSIEIPSGVSYIESYAFVDCDSLEDVIIYGDYYTYLEDGVFNSCDVLNYVDMEDSRIYHMGKETFYNCPKLTHVYLPDSIETIGEDSFEYCDSLQFYKYGGCSYLGNYFNTNFLALIKVNSGNYNCEVNKSTKIIADGAFKDAYVYSVKIPEGVEYIGEAAFMNCNIEEIRLPTSVHYIEPDTFKDCDELETIYIPASVWSIGNGAFDGCEWLRDVYFVGNEEDWYDIDVGYYNYSLYEATLHFDKHSHQYDSPCDYICNICGAYREAPHSFTSNWDYNEELHTLLCDYCGAGINLGEHIFSSACDPDCNVCGYKRSVTHSYKTTWSSDGSQHWHECSVCGTKKDTAAHVYDNSKDTTCNVCGAIRQHVYSSKWTSDETAHWHTCTDCGDVIDYAKHIFVGRKCSVCGYETSSDAIATLSPVKCNPGDTVTLTVTLDRSVNIKGAAVDIKLPEGFTLLDGDWVGKAKTEATLALFDAAKGKGASAYASTNFYASGEIFEFTVKATQNEGDYKAECTVQLKGGDLKDLTVISVPASIAVKSYTAGDVDDDGDVDADDAIYLLYYTFFPEEYPINQPVDFDGDGDVDADDAIHLLYYTFFPDSYPLN